MHFQPKGYCSSFFHTITFQNNTFSILHDDMNVLYQNFVQTTIQSTTHMMVNTSLSIMNAWCHTSTST